MRTLELLSNLRRKGIEIWADCDRLRYNAPKGVLTPDLRKELADRKPEILALLRQADTVISSASFPLKPALRTGDLPLSFAQQRLWFLNQLGTGSAYNISWSIRLKGLPNVKALEESLNEIIRRHEALRTTFRSAGGRPVQVIAKNMRSEMPLIDLSGQPKAEREAEAERLARDEALRRFDLVKGPLFTAALIRLSEEDHILLFAMHHIVSDGWSIAILTRELMVLYEAFSNEDPSPLPELPIQYADFASWQREWLQGEVLEDQLSYWREQLEGVPVLELLTDRPRPAVQTFVGASQNIALSPTLTEALNDLSQRQGVTLFITLLAAFQTLLFRYTGQEDIVVGSPIANRNRTEVEGLIGFFVNSLAMRTNLSGNPSFLELLERVREVALGAFARQDIPFEKLVEELHPERDISRTPLFQIIFAIQNMPAEALQLPGLTLSPFALERTTARFDIEIYLWVKSEGLSGRVVYNTDLFEDATIARLMGHYETLLESIVSDPDQRISEVQTLTDTERQKLLFDWNDTSSEYPRDVCIHHLFEAQVEQTPEAVAVVFEGERLNYRELEERANRLARHLVTLGVRPGVLVGLCLERSLEMVVGLLGILKAGGAYVPLDPVFPAERLAFMLVDAEVPVLVTQERLREGLPEHRAEVVSLDGHAEHIAAHAADPMASAAEAEDLAYVIYTSGSTGQPKGVEIPHRALVNFLTAMQREPGLAPEDVLLAVTTLSFDIAVLEIFLPLCCGARVVVASRETAVDGEALAALLSSTGATVMQATPTTWRLMVETGWSGDGRLKALVGGEAWGWNLAATLLERCSSVWNMYGPTETTIWSAVRQVQAGDERVSISGPIANTQLYVLDACLQPVPIGVPGELFIGGVGLARGYRKRPELTAERFLADPFEADGRLYRTGDRVRYRADGSLEFLGRLDHQVKLRGYRIELGEIEAVLGQHPEVRATAALVREDEPGDKRLVGYIVPAQESVSASALRRYLQERVPDYMVPAHFVMLDALPVTPNGKVDRRALPAPEGRRPELDAAYQAPRGPLEETLARIWTEVLRTDQVGRDDNFFDLGGHSLLATQMVSRIQRELKVDLRLIDVFRMPTIAELTKGTEGLLWIDTHVSSEDEAESQDREELTI